MGQTKSEDGPQSGGHDWADGLLNDPELDPTPPPTPRPRDRRGREIFVGDDVEWGNHHVGEVVESDRLGLQVKVVKTTNRTYQLGSVIPIDPRAVKVLDSSIFRS